jgi:DNA polymerase V
MIVLADCNNFFVSCEKVFNPRLEGAPVVVLSSNDGCVVSRSNEAKKLGIKMGDPYFQIKEFCTRHGVAVFSSNFMLYQDLSRRVMEILTAAQPNIQIYSVDEAFLEYPENEGIVSICKVLRKQVNDWVGIPISLGIAPTKTLAKVAGNLAKKSDSGVFDIRDPEVQREVLAKYAIGEVWGIGSRLAKVLKEMGIHNALDFREMDPPIVRKKMGVIGERLLWELRGLSCNHLEERKPKKSITVSRSFGAVITDQETLAEALATFAAAASEKLRKQGSKAAELSIFLGDGAEIESSEESFYQPTSDTSQIIAMAKLLLARIFTPTKRYKKCGVLLAGLILEDAAPSDLFAPKTNPKRKALMNTIDTLNGRFGKNRLFFAAAGVNPTWGPRKDELSSHNTTEWDALPVVKS